MPDFSILLSAPEGKQAGGNPFAPDMFDYRATNTFNYFSELNPERRALIQALHTALDDAATNLNTLFGIKGATLEDALENNRNVMQSPLMSALERYSPGVMYKAMDFETLPTGAQRRLLENGVIFSGLFGLLRPDDLIPNYRLKMDARLKDMGKISAYWRPQLSDVLNRALADRFVWNLLPQAHQDAWENAITYREMVQLQFFKETKGERKPVTHHVKPLRGALVNFIARFSAEDISLLAEWEAPGGFVLDEDASTWEADTRTHHLVLVAPA